MSNHNVMETEELRKEAAPYPTGKLVINYLQGRKDGATVSEIVRHLQVGYGKSSDELGHIVESLLENGTVLGFLERKGSQYTNWMARGACGSRRKRRRRRRRRKSCGRRKIRRRRRQRRKRC